MYPYQNIIRPLAVGNINLSGRVVMPPIATYLAEEDGRINQKVLDYYSARAKNSHIALLYTEHMYIEESGRCKPRQIGIDSDDKTEGLARLVELIHNEYTLAACQINYAGEPDSLSAADIHRLTGRFAEAALRAKKAGYDMVEIHSAHGYLLNQFYSPLTNHRTDAYGGSLENRLRFLGEVIAAVRAAVGPDYPLSVRLGGCDYMEGGSSLEDAAAAAKMTQAAGIDLLSLTGGMCRYTREGHDEPGYFKDLSLAVKAAVSMPVLLAGGVKTLAQADALLAEGAADLIGVGREMLKNASWEMTPEMIEAKRLRAIEAPHHNCAQTVLMAFEKRTGMPAETAYKLAVNFGGGMKIKDTCGAFTGGLMVLGLLGSNDPEVPEEYARRMKANHHETLNCGKLLEMNEALGREKKPHCDALVYESIEILEDLLRERGLL